jgi:hypothetical protein
MNKQIMFASALAVLGLTACEKGLDVGEDFSPTGQVKNSVLLAGMPVLIVSVIWGINELMAWMNGK